MIGIAFEAVACGLRDRRSAVSGPAQAQEFPSRTVKIVMGFGPGGLGDIAGAPSGR